PVTADLDHIVHPANDPEVAVLVAFGRVPRGVLARVLRPVLAYVAIRIAIDGSKHRRPGMLQYKITFRVVRDRVALFIYDLGLLSKEWARARAGLERNRGRGRDHEHAGLGLPPGIHNGAFLFADHAV